MAMTLAVHVATERGCVKMEYAMRCAILYHLYNL